MVEAMRSITDPVQRVLALQRLQDTLSKARRDVSVMRSQTIRELRDHRDAEHPDGWSLAAIADLLGLKRGNVQYIAEGRGLARESDETETGRE